LRKRAEPNGNVVIAMTRIRRASAVRMSTSAKATECFDAIFPKKAYFGKNDPFTLNSLIAAKIAEYFRSEPKPTIFEHGFYVRAR
jgi:hypothetical protein